MSVRQLPGRGFRGVPRASVRGGIRSEHRTGTKKGELAFALRDLAEWTGLEPATPGVTGRYSNQLNYHSTSGQRARQPQLVGADGIEPPTFAL